MAIHAAGGVTGSATSTGSFGNIDITGDAIIHGTLTAREMAISSSVTNVTTLAISGSSKFGDSIDDKHQMTGSLLVTGSMGVNQTSPASLIHVKAKTTSDDAGITWSSAHPYNWSIGLDAGAGHYFKITNSDTPGGGTDYMSFGGQSVTFPSGVTQINMLADNIYIGNAIRHYGEADVSIEMTSNQIEFQADDQSMILTPNHLSGSSTNPKGFSGSFNHVIVANKITGSAISTGSFGKLLGDGSDLSGISGFPFTGSAGISGSLLIDRQAANSGSTVFSVNGSQGNLFSLVDDFDGELFSVRNKAGVPFFIVNSDSTMNLGPSGDPLKFSKNNSNHSEITSSANFSASFGRLNVASKILVGGSDLNDIFINEGDVSGFPFTGSIAGISGSLAITRDAPNSGSSVFTIDGSQGRLFEIVDDNTDNFFKVTNGAGLPLFKVTSDDNIEFPKSNQKISGSSTSTGSFGDLKIGAVASGQLYSSFSSSIASRVASAAAGGISFNGSTANGLVTYGGSSTADVESGLTYTGAGGDLSISGDLVVRDTTSTHIRIDAPTNYDSSLIFAENAVDRWYLWHEADNDRLEFYVTGNNPGASGAGVLFKLHPTGHFEVAGANAKISGSSTSTGSFGSLVVDDKVQGNLKLDTFESVKYSQVSSSNIAVHIKSDNADSSTSIVDSGPNGLTLTNTGVQHVTGVTSPNGYGRSSLEFGTNDKINIQDSHLFNFGTNDWTIEFWFRPATGASGHLVSFGNDSSNRVIEIHLNGANTTNFYVMHSNDVNRNGTSASGTDRQSLVSDA